MSSNPLIRSWINKSRYIFIYGTSGTGKTHIALSFANYSNSFSKEACIIATEIGTLSLLRYYPLKGNIKAFFVESVKSLLNAFLKCLEEERYIVIDTINALYAGNPDELKIIGLISALSRDCSVGVLALGQVRETDHLYPATWQAILPWAEIVGRTSRKNDKFILMLEKPRRAIMMFKIKDGEVKWI